MKVTIDLASYNAANDSESEEYFELAGKHFCEGILTGDDPHMPGNKSIGIAKFCKGREADMCKISNFRVVHVPASSGFDCPVSGGTATAHANGLTRSYAYVCYKKVTSWATH